MKKYFILSAFILFIASCSTPTIFNVTKPGEEPEEYLQRAVYVLPQTLLEVKIEYEKETYIPGPYRFFTEKYLGMNEFISEPGMNYRIINVDVKSFTEPDPEHFYSINLIKGTLAWDRYLEMSRYGLVLDPSVGTSIDFSRREVNDLPPSPYFTDLSVESNLIEITDTLYKTVISDSSYVRIPVIRKHLEAKTLEQKAEAAADFIIKIRKRRFKLLAGQYELFPEGDALAISVEELDKLEREYLELFLGKRIKQEFSKSFVVTPSIENSSQSIGLARFSPMNGLLPAETTAGNMITLNIETVGKFELISGALHKSVEKKKQNTLYYRIPDIATITVGIMNDELYQGRMTLFQLGEIVGFTVSGK